MLLRACCSQGGPPEGGGAAERAAAARDGALPCMSRGGSLCAASGRGSSPSARECGDAASSAETTPAYLHDNAALRNKRISLTSLRIRSAQLPDTMTTGMQEVSQRRGKNKQQNHASFSCTISGTRSVWAPTYGLPRAVAVRHSARCVRIWRACWPLGLSALATATSATKRRARIVTSEWCSPARAVCVGSVRVALSQDTLFNVVVTAGDRELRLRRLHKIQVLPADRVRLLAANAA